MKTRSGIAAVCSTASIAVGLCLPVRGQPTRSDSVANQAREVQELVTVLLGRFCPGWSTEEVMAYAAAASEPLRSAKASALTRDRLAALKRSLSGRVERWQSSDPLRSTATDRHIAHAAAIEDIRWRLELFASRPPLSDKGRALLERQLDRYVARATEGLTSRIGRAKAQALVKAVHDALRDRMEDALAVSPKAPLSAHQVTDAEARMDKALGRLDRFLARSLPQGLPEQRRQRMKQGLHELAHKRCVSGLVAGFTGACPRPPRPDSFVRAIEAVRKQQDRWLQARQSEFDRMVKQIEEREVRTRMDPYESCLFLAEQMFLLLALGNDGLALF